MQRRRSIAVLPYRSSPFRVLVMKRIPRKGGGWQPVTGRVEDGDAAAPADATPRTRVPGAAPAEDDARLAAAALRELHEETGLRDVRRLVDLGVESTFRGYDDREYAEHAFAAEVPPDARITLSAEHEDARWLNAEEALAILPWPENRDALLALARWLGESSEE